jgi:hypothetical protein
MWAEEEIEVAKKKKIAKRGLLSINFLTMIKSNAD